MNSDTTFILWVIGLFLFIIYCFYLTREQLKNLLNLKNNKNDLEEYNRYSTFFHKLNLSIRKMDKHHLTIRIPNPITNDWIENATKAQIIFKESLKKDKFYYGRCRNASIAKWNGQQFIYIRQKFNNRFKENINHFEDDNGFDLFIPLFEISEEDIKIPHIKNLTKEINK